MARTETDSWDLASSVGVTATGAAAARARASRCPNALISDPFAEVLVEAVGIDALTQSARGELTGADNDGPHARMADFAGTRSKFFDEFLLDATAEGIRQVVILASGLDARAYRLPWPVGTVVYEIDQPKVIEFKTAVLAERCAKPTAEHEPIGMDLRFDWPNELRRAGFEVGRRSVWLAEGLLGYLPPDAQDRLLDAVTDLSADGSRLATEETVGREREQDPDGFLARMRGMADSWGEHGLDLDAGELLYLGGRNEAAAYLNANGWNAVGVTTNQLFSRYGLTPLHESMPWGDCVHITATLNKCDEKDISRR
jgi:methyltransferase (TIGR00027 family)